MTAVAVACFVLLGGAAALCLYRVVRCRLLADRAIALDIVTATVVCGVAVGAAWTRDGLFVDLALVLGLLGFLAAISVARFLGRSGS